MLLRKVAGTLPTGVIAMSEYVHHVVFECHSAHHQKCFAGWPVSTRVTCDRTTLETSND